MQQYNERKQRTDKRVANIKKNNSIPETNALMGAKKTASALAAEEIANKKAVAAVIARKRL